MRKWKIGIILVLLLLLVVFIWGNSLLSGEVSSAESGRFKDLLEPQLAVLQSYLEKFGITITQRRLVRKLAHIAEYMALGFLLGLLLEKKDGRPRLLLPEILCGSIACLDEFIQMLVDGRDASVFDVVLDSVSAGLGILLAALLVGAGLLCRKWKNRWKDHKKPDG